jgi:hypothetical protein
VKRLWFVALLAVAGCGAAAPPVATVTVTAPPTATKAPTKDPTKASPEAKTCTVPNVVGMVHQTAQDTMQAAGLYFLAEEDATGKGRVLVLDRNWETTAQSVAAGEVVDCTTKITLSAKKIGE